MLVAGSVFASWSLFAQGTINFANNNGSAVMDSLTGNKILAGSTFNAGLYWAVDGTVDDTLFVQIGASGNIQPLDGLIAAGTRTTPNETAPGGNAMFQVRVWETAYGSSYEAVLANGTTQNGRLGLAGKSNIVRATTGNPGGSPPSPAGSLITAGLQAFSVDVVPEPSILGLGMLGVGAFWALRRRK